MGGTFLKTGCCIFRATGFRYFRLNGLPTLWFSRRRPQISVCHVLEHSFCFTLDALDPWRLVAYVAGFYKLLGSANDILGWIGLGPWGSVGVHILTPVLKESWGLRV